MQKFFFNTKLETDIINANFVCGAAWILTKECVKTVGGFDPTFYHYGEDDNYVNRTLFYGYKVGILPYALIYHDRDLSSSHFHSNDVLHARRDSTILLNRACDPNKTSYKSFILKRFLRYGLSGVINTIFFKKVARKYHFDMARFIINSYTKIGKSRRAALTESAPYVVTTTYEN